MFRKEESTNGSRAKAGDQDTSQMLPDRVDIPSVDMSTYRVLHADTTDKYVYDVYHNLGHTALDDGLADALNFKSLAGGSCQCTIHGDHDLYDLHFFRGWYVREITPRGSHASDACPQCIKHNCVPNCVNKQQTARAKQHSSKTRIVTSKNQDEVAFKHHVDFREYTREYRKQRCLALESNHRTADGTDKCLHAAYQATSNRVNAYSIQCPFGAKVTYDMPPHVILDVRRRVLSLNLTPVSSRPKQESHGLQHQDESSMLREVTNSPKSEFKNGIAVASSRKQKGKYFTASNSYMELSAPMASFPLPIRITMDGHNIATPTDVNMLSHPIRRAVSAATPRKGRPESSSRASSSSKRNGPVKISTHGRKSYSELRWSQSGITTRSMTAAAGNRCAFSNSHVKVAKLRGTGITTGHVMMNCLTYPAQFGHG